MATPASASDEAAVQRTVNNGLVFINGTYIESPYTIEAALDAVRLNGVDLKPEQLSRPAFGGNRGPWWLSGGGDPKMAVRFQRMAVQRAAMGVAASLESGSIVVIFDQQKASFISGGGQEFYFYDALLAEDPSPQQVENFVRLAGGDEQMEIWKEWLFSFQVPEQLRQLIEPERDRIDQITQAGLDRTAAIVRLDQLNYPLTIIAMVLGVMTFGHLLKWKSRDLAVGSDSDPPPETIRHAEIALLFMCSMAVVDLAWTILASQAGVMKEVNPMAAHLLGSPILLVAFKIAATLVGAGILFGFRRQRIVREATWWACLICVLVTFRWVMFDSVV